MCDNKYVISIAYVTTPYVAISPKKNSIADMRKQLRVISRRLLCNVLYNVNAKNVCILLAARPPNI